MFTAQDLYGDLSEESQGQVSSFHSPRGGAGATVSQGEARNLLEQADHGVRAVSAEKLQLQLQLVEAQTAVEPLRFENAQLYRERDILKTKAEETLTELDASKKENLRLLSEKLDLERKLQQTVDENLRLNLEITHKLSDANAEAAAWRTKFTEAHVEVQAMGDAFEVEKASLEEKLRLKESLVAIYEAENQAQSELMDEAANLRQTNDALIADYNKLSEELGSVRSQLTDLANEREILLAQRVVDADGECVAVQVLQQLMRKPQWRISELVSELTHAREAADAASRARAVAEQDLLVFRQEVDTQARIYDDQKWRTASLVEECDALRRKLDATSTDLNKTQRQLADERVHRVQLEADKSTLSVVLSEKVKTLAATLHELELTRARLTAGPGRMLPPLLPQQPAEEAGGSADVLTVGGVRQVVEENAALRTELLSLGARSERELNEKTQSLIAELAFKSGKLADLEGKVEDLVHELDRNKKLLADATAPLKTGGTPGVSAGAVGGVGAAVGSGSGLIGDLEAEITRARLAQSKLQAQFAKVQQQCGGESKKAVEFEAQLRQTKSELSRVSEESRRLEKRSLRLQQDLDDLKNANAHLLAQNSSLAKNSADLQLSLSSETASVGSLRKALAESNALRAQQLETIKTLNERLDALKSTYDQNLAQLNQLFQDERARNAQYISFAQNAIESVKASASAAASVAAPVAHPAPQVPVVAWRPAMPAEDESTKWRELAEAAESVAESQRVRIRALERALADAQSAGESDVAPLQTEISDLKKSLAARISELDEARMTLAHAKTELVAVQRRCESAVQGEEVFRREAEAATSKTKELEVLVAKTVNQVENVTEDLDRARQELKLLHAENGKLLASISGTPGTAGTAVSGVRSAWQVREEGLQFELQMARAKAEATGAENAQLKRRLEEVGERSRQLEQQLMVLEAAKRRLGELEVVETENKQLFADLTMCRSRLDQTSAELAETRKTAAVATVGDGEGEVEKLKIEKEQLEKARAQLATTVKNLREQFGEGKKKWKAEMEKLVGLLKEYQEVLAEVTGSSTSKKKTNK
jgi:chromosome segregation ATPase